jgi:glycosyltransferase involved in cell wall biosynthesis
MNPPLIDVVVPTYNRRELLDRLIESLLEQSYAADRYRIIIVDDGSFDATPNTLRAWALRDRRIQPLRIEHAGASSARNHGWRDGTGEIVAFTDDDCFADRHWLSELAVAFDERPDALGIYGKTLTYNDQTTPLTYQIIAPRPNTNYRTCNIAYRREALIAAGGFDEKSAYSEDAQLAAAVLQRGPILFCPPAIIIHPPRPRTFSDRRSWQPQLEGLFRLYSRQPQFFRRHWGGSFALAVAWRLGFGSTVKQLLLQSPWILRNPLLYLKFFRSLLRERITLLMMLPEFCRRQRDRRPRTHVRGGARGSDKRPS